MWCPIFLSRCSRSFVLLGLVGACNGRGPAEEPHDPAQKTQDRIEIDVFAFGRQLGAVAPCGCTTDPLGGLPHALGYVQANSDPRRRLVLEPGSFLFPDPGGPEAPRDDAAWAQAERRAELLQAQFSRLPGLVSGLGPTDLASPRGKSALPTYPLPRVLGNPGAEVLSAVETHRIVELDGIAAGVTAVTDPASMPELALVDPVIAARERIFEMKTKGTKLEVVLVQGPRELAERVAREVEGVDLVVMGGKLEGGADRARLGSAPLQIGSAYLLEPGDQAQTISHVTLSLADADDLAPAPSWKVMPSESDVREQLARLDAQLAKFEKDPDADPAFLENLRRQRQAIERGGDGDLGDVSVAVVFEQAKINCRLAVDETAKKGLADYDGWVAHENARRFAGVQAPKPKKGHPGYVGIEACAECHEEAVAYWDTTIHARAYETLERANKQFDWSCVGCHVTGFRRPGGAEVVENAGLRDVQCEQCHGPGSLHAADPSAFALPGKTEQTVCAECHTPEHSDTFEYEAYLRDVLGDGHGADARAALGEGATGRELRAAGLAKADGGCTKK